MNDRSSNPLDPRELVPSELPPARNPSDRADARFPAFLMIPAAMGLWFSPKRIGVRLGTAGWHTTLVTHVLAIIIGFGLIAWAEHIATVSLPLEEMQIHAVDDLHSPAPAYADRSALDWIRAPFAALALGMYDSTAFVVPSVTFPRILAGLELCVVLMAFIAMPFAAAGETKRRLFGRCLRLSLWSTTVLVLLGLGWMTGVWARPWLGMPKEWHPFDFIGLGVFAIWWLMVLLRSGYQYAGPPDGPAWTPRTPRCESCGYTIAHLELTTRCPECGRPVADSLPERREIPGEHTAPGPLGFIRFCATTLVAIFTDAQFFSRLAVHRGHARARAFFITLAAFNATLLAAATFAFGKWSGHNAAIGDAIAQGIVIGCWFFVVQIMTAGVATCVSAIIGKRDVQRDALVCFYSLSSMVILTLAIALSLAAIPPLGWAIDSVRGRGIAPNVAVGILAACALVGLGAALITMTRIARRAARDTRFANQ